MRSEASISRRSAFVDTGAFAAVAIERESDHGRAVATADRLARSGWKLVTTNFVIAEAYSLILSRAGRDAAYRFLMRTEAGAIDVRRVAVEDEARAKHILAQYQDKDFSLVDAMSFAVMERLGLNVAFAFDHHFSRFGFQLAT